MELLYGIGTAFVKPYDKKFFKRKRHRIS